MKLSVIEMEIAMAHACVDINELAAKIDVHRMHISQILNGRRNPKPKTIGVCQMLSMGGKIGGFFSKIDIQVLKTTAIILGIVAALIALVAIIAVLTGKGPDVERTMSSISKGVNGIASPGSLPHNDTGTSFWRGGPTYINERGGEIAVLPSGSQIIPHDISMAIAQGRGNQNITVNVNAHDLQQVSDVVNLFEGYKQYMRAR